MIKMNSPWGQTHYVHYHGSDKLVVRVSTSEHGGIGVHPDVSMPLALACLGMTDDAGWRWFEEDLAWAIPVVALPERFPEDWVTAARDTLRNEFPQAYMAHFSVVLTPKESRLLEQMEWDAATRNRFTPTAGFGSEFYNVPPGTVWVAGLRLSDEATAGFLVPEVDYLASGSRLILDGFQRWEPDRTTSYRKPAPSVTGL